MREWNISNCGTCPLRKREVSSTWIFIKFNLNHKNKLTFFNAFILYVLILGKTQEEGLMRVEELKAEIVGLKELKRDEEKRQIDLERENASLTAELTKEKVTQMVLSYMEHSFFSFECRITESND